MPLVAKIIDNNKDNWFYEFYGCVFQILSIREKTVLVKSNIDEGYKYPHNVHEFPKKSIEIIEAVWFP